MKAKLAERALKLIEPGKTYFFDSGTTVFAIAEAFRDHPITPVTIVTSNLPVGEMLAAIPGVEVFQVAGQLLHLQSTLLGETARRSLEFWSFDWAFLSAEAMTPAGLWNSQSAIVEQQKVLLQRSHRHVFCIDGSKLHRQAPHLLIRWDELDTLLTEIPLDQLRDEGIMITPDHYLGELGDQADLVPESSAHTSVSHNLESDDLPVHYL